MDHAEVLHILEIMFQYPGDSEEPQMVDTLVVAGLSQLEAELAVALVPSALARPILEKAGVSEIRYFAKNRQGEWVEVDLWQHFIYQEVVVLARQKGWLNGSAFDGYKTIVGSTAELQTLDKAFKEGTDVKGGKIKTYLPRVTAEQLGYNNQDNQ